jgi:hypothetical protein
MFYDAANNEVNALAGFIDGISMYKYYTMQTNLFVAIWLTIALIFNYKPDKLKKIKGVIKGGITIYITITFIVFAIMLSSLYNPTETIERFTNIATHYIIPIAFLLDWVFTEKTINYKWLNLVFWIIYPILYLVLAIIHGTITGDYLYPFLDVVDLGYGYFFLSVLILLAAFIFLGILLILVNKLWNNRINSITTNLSSEDNISQETD